MAYLHCHKCDFSQDDFWTLRYNPVSWFFRETLPWLWKPRLIWVDPPSNGVPEWKRFKHENRWYAFSWHWLFCEFFVRVLNPKVYLKMHWWTNKSWKKAIKRNGGEWPACPKCRLNRTVSELSKLGPPSWPCLRLVPFLMFDSSYFGRWEQLIKALFKK